MKRLPPPPTKPEPGETVQAEGYSIECRGLCACCKPSKAGSPDRRTLRYFLRDSEGKVICMAHDWHRLAEQKGWA